MNPRLAKEARELLPAMLLPLPLILLPYSVFPTELAQQSAFYACVIGCAVMAALSFGHEFQHRTLPLLLTQPVPRDVIWREKMSALGLGLLVNLSVLLAALGLLGTTGRPDELMAMAAGVALFAFCSIPYWTLVTRSGIIGALNSVAIPFTIAGALGALALIVTRLTGRPIPITDQAAEILGAVLFLAYCASLYFAGHAEFNRHEVMEARPVHMGMPPALEARLVTPLMRVFSGFSGPFASLVKKELRLQQFNFVLAGAFCVLSLVAAVFRPVFPEFAEGLLVAGIGILCLGIPILTGAVSIAEESSWGITGWHLTLPPSTRKQWTAKMLVTFSTSLVLGLLLPTLVLLAGMAIFQPNPNYSPTQSVPLFNALTSHLTVLIAVVIGYSLVTGLAVYAASVSDSTLRAACLTFGIIIAATSLSGLAGAAVVRVLPQNDPPDLLFLVTWLNSHSTALVHVFSGMMAVFLYALLRLAYSGFRYGEFRLGRVVFQAASIVVVASIIGLFGMLVVSLHLIK